MFKFRIKILEGKHKDGQDTFYRDVATVSAETPYLAMVMYATSKGFKAADVLWLVATLFRFGGDQYTVGPA